MNFQTGNQSVDAIGTMHFEGNITPSIWYKNITMPDGKPDLVSITILAEILYWHRPTIVRDETTGAVIGSKKKFKADLLQRSYDSFAEQFGLTKRQVKDSIVRLETLGVIHREFRTIPSPKGPLSNVLFIGMHAEVLAKLTYSLVPYDVQTSEGVSRLNVGGVTLKRGTYTESTTNISTTTAPKKIPLIRHFEENCLFRLSTVQMQKLYDWRDDFGGDDEADEIVRYAAEIASDKNRRSFAFVESVLKEWSNAKVNTVAAAKSFEADKFSKPNYANTSAAKPRIDFDSFKD